MSAQRPEDLQRQLAGLSEIGQVVGALRAIAGGHMALAREARQAVQAHADTVAQALASVGHHGGAPAAGPGLVLVIGASQGFSGGYASRIAAAASQAAAAGAALVVLGQRTVSLLGTGLAGAVKGTGDLPAHVEQVPERASAVADTLVTLSARHPGPIDVIAGHDTPGQPVSRRRIWPPPADGEPPASITLTTLPVTRLIEALLVEALFAAVALAMIEGFRAENQARSEAMSRAQSNLRHRRDEVQTAWQQARQEQLTTELVELGAGLQAPPVR